MKLIALSISVMKNNLIALLSVLTMEIMMQRNGILGLCTIAVVANE